MTANLTKNLALNSFLDEFQLRVPMNYSDEQRLLSRALGPSLGVPSQQPLLSGPQMPHLNKEPLK